MQVFRFLAVAVIVAAAATAACRQRPEGDSATQSVLPAEDPFSGSKTCTVKSHWIG